MVGRCLGTCWDLGFLMFSVFGFFVVGLGSLLDLVVCYLFLVFFGFF